MACFPGDDIGDNIIAHGVYEDLLLEGLFGVVLAPKAAEFKAGLAMDIGANIGNHSLWFSSRFARVLAFEPNPICTRLIEASAMLNGAENIQALGYGLSESNAELVFRLNLAGNLGQSGVTGSLVLRKSRSFPVQVRVADEAVTDEMLDGLPVRLVKIDVEGHELSVLKGMTGLLAKHRPIVLFESHGARGDSGSDAIADHLNSIGYANYYVIERVRSPYGSKLLRAIYRIAKGQELSLRQVDRPEDRPYSLVIATCEPLAGLDGTPAAQDQ
ncbi:FkbM family methyltransferase [Flagellatimonas centrodinii]|uniref:FkbM family methyltransferase n=1 Tax=Flagellatimonas centrodinii TaxID=2806210 RepID=UPI001EFBFEFD|nr:FkbM family methyltransferase [Flagellatimonas centrodinii]ULQ46702.1 FkbM family methyltransferase [Flagellatimonas centrodinii]